MLNSSTCLTNVNADDISAIRPRVDISIKTGARVIARLVDTLLRAIPIVNLTLIDVITSKAISAQGEAHRTRAAE